MNKHRLALFAALSLWAFPTFAADSTVTAMPAAGALTGPELFYCIQGGVDSKCTASQVQTFAGPAGANLTLQFNNAGAFGGMSGTSWDDTNRSLTITGATITASHPIFDLSQTWNNAATTFKGFSLAITDTTSASTSLPVEVSLGGTVLFSVSKIGQLASFGTGASLYLRSASSQIALGAANDLILTRKTAASWRLGNFAAASPVAQILGVQEASGTDTAAAATFAIVGPLATGNAAPGDIVMQTGAVGASGTTVSTATTALTIKGTSQNVIAAKQIVPGTVTVAALPTGVEGGLINVSDQLTVCPVKGGTFTGGGDKTCLAHFEEGAWVAP